MDKRHFALLIAFARTGHIDGLRLGMSPTQVVDRLGEPDGVSVRKVPLIWKFGAVQVTMIEDAAVMIGVYGTDGVIRWPATLLPTRGAGRPIQRSELLRELVEAGVHVEPDPALSFGRDQSAYRSGAGVALIFNETDRFDKALMSALGQPTSK